MKKKQKKSQLVMNKVWHGIKPILIMSNYSATIWLAHSYDQLEDSCIEMSLNFFVSLSCEQMDSMLPCIYSVTDHTRCQNVERTFSDTRGITLCATLLLLPHFYVICDQLQNRRAAIWNLLILFERQARDKLTVSLILYLLLILLKLPDPLSPCQFFIRVQTLC